MTNKDPLYPGKWIKFIATIKFYGFAAKTIMRYYFKQIIFIFIFMGLVASIWKSALYFRQPEIQPGSYRTQSGFVTIKVPYGTSAYTILDSLHARGLIDNMDWAKILVRLFRFDRQFKSGLFDIPDSLNTYQTLYYLAHAHQKLIKLTIPEGLTYKKIAGIVEQNFMINEQNFIQLCKDSTFIRSLGLNVSNLEGYLHPETYFFQYNVKAEAIIKRLVKEQLKIFETDSVKQRLNEMEWSMHQVLTLASIIEGEAVLDKEMPLISSVYHNRLKKRMRLQADPTIQYLLKDGPRRLTYRDLEIDSPYNTYKYRGLPPGPINNPGTNAILAALYPAPTDYLYFVAVGDGSHHFSKTIREHNRWKRKFNRLRKKIYGY